MPLVGKRYAEALAELAAQAAAIDEYQKDLQLVVDGFNNLPEFRLALLNPKVKAAEKKGLIIKSFGATINTDVLNFVLFVLEKGRIRHLSGILKEFVSISDKRRKILNIRVLTAAPLEAEQINRIKEKFIIQYNAVSAKVEQEIDRDLIGGVKVIIGDKVADGSIKGRLEELMKLMAGS